MADGRGRLPHRREGSHSLRQYISDDRFTQMEVLFDRGFTLDIERRYQTCEELASRLHDVLNAPRNKAANPQALASLSGQQLQERDRTTQLENHRKAAEKVLAIVHEIFVRVNNSHIAPFDIVSTGADPIEEGQLPQGLDGVRAGRTFLVSLTLQRSVREIRIGFGAAGHQTVMLLQIRSPAPKAVDLKSGWEKAVWFNPDELPSAEVLVELLNRYLDEAMRLLYEAVVHEGPPAQP
jgi:hypothetical protein